MWKIVTAHHTTTAASQKTYRLLLAQGTIITFVCICITNEIEILRQFFCMVHGCPHPTWFHEEQTWVFYLFSPPNFILDPNLSTKGFRNLYGKRFRTWLLFSSLLSISNLLWAFINDNMQIWWLMYPRLMGWAGIMDLDCGRQCSFSLWDAWLMWDHCRPPLIKPIVQQGKWKAK